MKNVFVIFFAVAFGAQLAAQRIADFESFGLQQGAFLNNAGNGRFTDAGITLPNTYDPQGFWNGWAISAVSDTQTPGFTNEYAAITGSGVDGSTSYALAYQFGPVKMYHDSIATGFTGLHITNGTYAYLSMLEGDGFAKRFGGESGNDPDYFLLTIKGYYQGELLADSIDFYLADYRFADNSQDYIVDEWTYVPLDPFNQADSLLFMLSSTDNGQFGMNTPAYFFIDNVATADRPSSITSKAELGWRLHAFPVPARQNLQLEWPASILGSFRVYNAQGTPMPAPGYLQPGINSVDVASWPAGMYLLYFEVNGRWGQQWVVKG